MKDTLELNTINGPVLVDITEIAVIEHAPTHPANINTNVWMKGHNKPIPVREYYESITTALRIYPEAS
jgi:hypothetical protein